MASYEEIGHSFSKDTFCLRTEKIHDYHLKALESDTKMDLYMGSAPLSFVSVAICRYCRHIRARYNARSS